MSEPQTRPTEELMSAPDSEHRVADVDPQTTPTPESTGPLKTLKDAFPDLDLDIIQTILASQDNRLDAAFEVLLGMSDPSYKPEPEQLEGLTQMQQDEAYARQLSREAYGQPTQDNSNRNNEPLFNFQEELPVIKEKVIEAGIAAKNKLVNLYNQFMEGPSESQQQQQQQTSTRQSNSLEDNMNNLRLSDNQNTNVDLYGGEGRMPVRSLYEQPNAQPNAQPKNTTSTPKEQLLSDEEFARRLAREDSELDITPTLSDTRHHEVVNQEPLNTTQKPAELLSTQHDSDQNEVTLSAVTQDTNSGYTHPKQLEHDDLDDLFNKPEEEEEAYKIKEK